MARDSTGCENVTMQNPFDSPRLAAGYASARPAVHPKVIELVQRHLKLKRRVNNALDVGCGAGLSTRPLTALAENCFGVEPSVAMLRLSARVAPAARFAAGKAEEIPFRTGAIDLMTAAGSLNWADLGRFFPEAHRVLTRCGQLIIYDFSQGANSPETQALAHWHCEFKTRYPSPPCQAIVPRQLRLAEHGFRLDQQQPFALAIPVEPDFYLDYAMTETNVEAAIRRGVPESEIRSWCQSTLDAVFAGRGRDVVFQGFLAYISKA